MSSGVNYDDVAKVASDMLSQGVKPTVRGVMRMTGGKTENVARYLGEFFDKRNADVLKMAGELGNSQIAELLANEIQLIVDRKTSALKEINEQQQAQNAELIELLKEKEDDCLHRVELAEAKATQTTQEASVKVKEANDNVTKMREEQVEALKSKEEAETASSTAIQANKQTTDALVNAAKQAANALVEAAKQETQSLVEAANGRAEKSESETSSLREQVKRLSIDEATRQIEKNEVAQSKDRLESLRSELGQLKVVEASVKAENSGYMRDIERLEKDSEELKRKSDALSQAQANLVEIQKQLSNAQHELATLEKQNESLSQAVALTTLARKKPDTEADEKVDDNSETEPG